MNEDKEILVEEYTVEDREDDYVELKEEGIIVSDEPTDNDEDLQEDIPFQEDWERRSLVDMKETLCNWIDGNLENEDVENYDIYTKEDETRLYMKVQQVNSEDNKDLTEDYYCIFEKHDTRKVEETDLC